MKLKKCLSASVVWLFQTLAIAQPSPWEDQFFFGTDQIGGTDAIQAVHLLHIFDGTRGKAVAITHQSQPQGPCGNPAPLYASEKARLWSFPLDSAAGPGTFENAPYCDTYMFCGSGHTWPHSGHDAIEPRTPRIE